MINYFANPTRFLKIAKGLQPIVALVAVGSILIGLYYFYHPFMRSVVLCFPWALRIPVWKLTRRAPPTSPGTHSRGSEHPLPRSSVSIAIRTTGQTGRKRHVNRPGYTVVDKLKIVVCLAKLYRHRPPNRKRKTEEN